MTKLVFVKVAKKVHKTARVTAAKRGVKASVSLMGVKRNRRAGKFVTLDADSATFGEELKNAFVKSVKRARRENKRVLGFADIAARKA